MDKDRVLKKRMSLDRRGGLPSPPPSPPLQKRSPQSTQAPVYPDAFRRLNEYKKRENEFLASLNEAITIDCQELSNEKQDKIRAQAEIDEITPWENATLQDLDQTDSQQNSPSLVKSDGEQLREECDTYLLPLLNRTGPSISAALVTYDAFDQLTKLHGLLNQLLEVRCQNYQMQKQIRDARTLCELKKLQKKDSLEKSEDLEFSDNELDLSAILAAGNSASTKRSTAKRQRERSKSVIADEIQMFASEKEKTSSLRRQSHQSQSAFSDSKAKISKWTKVKAAFKWERANVATMNEGKSLDSGISLGPLNHEVARYLRVPSAPCAGSSADSVLSSSSGHLLSGGSVPATPGTISSASSIEDVGGASEENHQDFNEESFRSIEYEVLKDIIPKAGPRSIFWKKFKEEFQTDSTVLEVATASNSNNIFNIKNNRLSTDFHENFEPNNISHEGNSVNTSVANTRYSDTSVQQLLTENASFNESVPTPSVSDISTPIFRQQSFYCVPQSPATVKETIEEFLKCPNGTIIKKFYENNKSLNESNRSKLASTIVHKEVGNSMSPKISSQRFLELSKGITEMFPSENMDVYYVPYNNMSRRLASGKLWESFNHLKRRLRSNSLNISTDNCDINNLDATLHEKLNYLKCHLDDDTRIKLYWKETRTYRLNMIMSEEYDIAGYFSNFACLNAQLGIQLLKDDFEFMYPDAKNFLTSWNEANSQLIKYSSKHRIDVSNYVNSSNEYAGLVILSFLFKSSIYVKKSQSGKRTKLSGVEVLHSFLHLVPQIHDLQEFKESWKRELFKKHQKFQPAIFLVGRSYGNNRDSSKSDSRCDSRANDEDNRRSRSLDGDTIISSSSLARDGKNKTPWKKVKDIIQTHRGSFKGKSRSRSVKSGETCSRDHSPCESIDALSNADDRNNDHGSSNPASPGNKNTPPSVSVSHESSVFSYSPHGSTSGLHNRDEYEGRHSKSSSRSNRKSRALTDFEVLPEDVIVDLKSTGAIHRGRLPPSPLNLRQDSSDAEYGEMCHSPTLFGKTKLFRSRKALASGNSSVPSSPSRHSEFFGDSDNIFRFPDTNLPSEDFSSGDFSEPPSPHRNNHEKLSPQSSLQIQQKEINEKYYELCEQLAQEFEAKQEEWKKIQAACASNAPTAFQMMTKDESSLATKNVPATLLEENLSPDFKKKLHKWRVKKQNSVTLKDPQISPTKENDQKKIDWNLWKTGQLKLEGQGLTPMPEQKDLSEDFQKKLEQWRKFKESNTVPSYTSQDSLKRSKKARDDSERYDRDKQRPEREKLKVHDKDKLEKLSKLKAMVTDVPAKEIEVKTSKGVMKFEGISRKFTRKLYEWEKAKGIGPESSTFALLHPGYRPLDVGNGSQDNAPQENSPVLGRSLSLDSISPNPSVPSISHQPSSLSLNDMKDSASAADGLGGRDDDDYDKDRQQDEPEAVIVEVEDDIVETAAPLVAAHPMFEHQTPVYKYEVPCTELCSTVAMDGSLYQRTHVSTEALHKVSSLKRLQSQQDEDYREHVVHVQSVLMSLEESLPEVESSIRGNKIQSLETLSSIKRLVRELIEMLCSLLVADRFDSNEFKERSRAIDSKLCSLQANINLVCKTIEAKKLVDPIPAINIISEETNGIGRAIVCVTPTIFHSQVLYEQPQVKISSPVVQEPLSVPAVLDNSRLDPGEGPSKKVNRTTSNSSKKKMRLRKMGSRQNSKTESDSDEDLLNVTLEAPRRVKRKTSKVKRSPDDERKPNIEEKRDENYGGEDIVYILKVKPGQKIEQEVKQDSSSEKNVLISPNELCVELMEAPAEQASSSANIFVKTKRKVFTTVEEVSRVEPKVVVAKELDSSSTSERTSRESSIGDSEKSRSQMPSSLPPIPQSPSTQRRDVKSSSLKEPSPSIRMMIQRYNQTVEKSTKAGSASPIIFRSPVLDRRLAKQNEHVERVVKSSSAGHIQCNDLVAVNIPEADYQPQDPKLPKASSADNLTQNDIDDECTVSSPLAYDSLKASKPKASPIVGAPFSEPEKKEKEHLYKKHKEKPTSLFSKSGAVKKIGLKTGKASENIWRRSISNTPNEPWLLPDKSDNTVPKISRKYESSLEIHAKSAPTTPMTEDFERPKTPLTERALKIQRAKEEFFKRDIQRSSTWETSSTKESTWQKRLSGSSFGSTASNDLQMGALLKSASVGFINTTTNENSSTEDYAISIPRPSEKTSKFGFSSIASKFRKVKMRRGAKEQSAKYNAISTLCRQSLAVVDMHADASAIQEQLKRAEMDKKVVEKSGSSHGLAFLSGLRKLEKLTKSRSANALTQNDKDTKEM